MKLRSPFRHYLSWGAAALVGLGLLSSPAEAHHSCTGYPMTATVSIHNPGTPYGPTTVNICSGGTVVFNNVNSGAAWTIRHVSGPGFQNVPLAMSPSSGQTQVFSHPGTTTYLIRGQNGVPDFVLPGTIVIH